ncbi:aggregation-promoting factor C-terminal-like domain-containing protein [Actinomyces mediterranea]|uniref:aggregation-promoting factor C-terminal-like domain-containing protein n=1 Tax=Actinomyces mediterranea TaxID=1871028 RepID=UPI00135665CB|nr:G5 domain-containing protein [Actinomyces mediterranea]
MNFTHPSRPVVITTASVLALALTATAGTAIATSYHDVTLEVNGVSVPAEGFFTTVDDVLTSAEVEVSSHDLIAPSVDTRVKDGDTIVVRTATRYNVTVDGESVEAWSTADSVDGVLDSVTADGSIILAADRSSVRDVMPVAATATTMTVEVDGTKIPVESTGNEDVEDLLATADVTVSPIDRVSFVSENGQKALRVTRVTRGNVVGTQDIEYTTENRDDDTLYEGETSVVQEGTNGSITTTSYRETVDGVTTVDVLLSEERTEPVNEIVSVGTKKKSAATPSSSAAVSVPNVSVSYDPASAQGIAAEMVAARGWSTSEFQCLVALWNRESGWNVTAGNASGAYGIPQALPGSKMASAGADWATNPATQITWGLGYIAGRYGTPCGAWSHFQLNNWY